MITLHLEAESLGELRAKMYAVLGDALGGNTATQAGPQDLPALHYTSPPASYDEQPGEYAGAATQAPPERDPVPEASDKPKRKPRVTKPPVAAPEPVEEVLGPLEEVDLSSFEDDVEGLEITSTPLVDTLANEKLKAEVIDRLADLFTAGKVKLLRSLLDTYGSGAKTFAEIDPGVFPKIRDAMQKGIDS